MKRPAGVTASAVVLGLTCLVQVLMALCMALTGLAGPALGRAAALPDAAPAQPFAGWMTVFLYALCAVCLALAAWGIVTIAGLLRLRRWARYSILVIGGCMALLFSMDTLLMLVLLAVPLPIPATPGGSDPHTAEAIYRIVMGVVAFCFATGAAVGIWWLVYFNRKPVRAVFAGATGEPAESRRPFLVSAYAVLCLIGAPCLLGAAFVPVPAALFGYLFEGWQKDAFYLIFAAVSLVTGAGLWWLKEWARRLALAVLALGSLQMIVYLVRPSLMLRNVGEIHRAMHQTPQPGFPPHVQVVFYAAIFGFSLLLMAATAYMLHYYRSRFVPSGGGQLEPPTPA